MAWNVGGGEAPEAFEDILREDSSSEVDEQEQWVEAEGMEEEWLVAENENEERETDMEGLDQEGHEECLEMEEEWLEVPIEGDEWLEMQIEEEEDEKSKEPDENELNQGVHQEPNLAENEVIFKERRIIDLMDAEVQDRDLRHSRSRSRFSERLHSRSRSRSPLPEIAGEPSENLPNSHVRQIYDEFGNELLPASLLTSRAASPPLLVAPSPAPSWLAQFDVEVVMENVEEPELIEAVTLRGVGRRAGRGRGAGRSRGGSQSRGSGRGRGVGRSRRAGRGQGAVRGRGQGQWRRGDRLVEDCVTDEDVRGELRENIMRVESRRAVQEVRRVRRERVRTAEVNDEADDGGDAALFDGDENALRFDWVPMNSFRGNWEQFHPERTGSTTPSGNAYEAFRQYWDDGILSKIVTETNRYAAALVSESEAFARTWYETNIHEILILFSFWMMLGIIRMPSTKACFTTNRLLRTHIFSEMFPRSRYENLCRALHFVNNADRTPESSRLFPIQPILDHLNSRFQAAYTLKQNICIDESLTLWKGKLSFRQYIKTKAARFGVKTFELCESTSGYLWSFLVYTGKDTTNDPRFPLTLLVSTKTVLKLVWPLLNKGYTLFMDNWFNCPLLARYLKRHGTDCVGTLRANRSNVPPIAALCKLQEGHFLARHSGDVIVMAYQDKKKIPLISTFHDNEQGVSAANPHVPPQWKPRLVLDYNKGMGGVDRKDQMLEPYLLERKRCSKWTMKLFKRLLNCSILNSRILLHDSTKQPKDHLVFRLELVEQIHNHHLAHVPHPTSAPRAARVSGEDLPQSRFTTEPPHWPRTIPTQIANGPKARTSRRRCLWCAKRRGLPKNRTTLECGTCEVSLCLDPCFKEYHTLP